MFNKYSRSYGDIFIDKYTNVNIYKLANIYFKGNVVSSNIFFEDGFRKIFVAKQHSKYEFNTNARELMEIIAG